MKRSTIIISIVSLALGFSVACKKKEKKEPETKAPEPTTPTETTTKEEPKPPLPTSLVAKLEPRSKSKVEGTVTFTQMDDKVKVDVHITGLPKGAHGFHVHEKGDCSAPDAKSAGGHFNPMGHEHAGPEADKQHAGDLGNIEANDKGVVETSIETDQISLKAGDKTSVVGRAVVVHAKPDDLKSQPSGAAGARVACGVIKPAETAATPDDDEKPDEEPDEEPKAKGAGDEKK